MNIFAIFAAASFEYAVYSNLAATDPLQDIDCATYPKYHLMNQLLKWCLPDQKFCSFLVPMDLLKGNCTRTITMGFLMPA